MGHYRFVKAAHDRHHFTFHGNSGERVFTSVAYGSSEAAAKAMANCRISSQFLRHLERTDHNGRGFGFALHAPSTGVIGTSEEFASFEAREAAMARFSSEASVADVEGGEVTRA